MPSAKSLTMLRPPIVVALLFALALPGGALSARSYHHERFKPIRCGTELWALKTLRDRDASQIDFAPHGTTIAWLAAQPAPRDPDFVTRRLKPVETTVWRVRAQLVGYRIEADGDYHLVLRDPQSGATLIGEIPMPSCVTTRGARYAALRAEVDRIGHHRATRYWWWLDYHGATPPTVTISGVGFFDRIHQQDGVARNGVELHPVLGVKR